MLGIPPLLPLSLRARRAKLPSFSSIATHYGFSTSAIALTGRQRQNATHKVAEESSPLTSSNGTRKHKESERPHVLALTSYRHLFRTRDRWLAHQLAQGHYIPPRILSKLLAHRRILADDLIIWVDVLARSDVYHALERLGLLESAGHDRNELACPDWLILAIPGMLNSFEDVPYLVSMLVRSERVKRMDAQSRDLFATRCLQAFLRIRHLVAVRETIEWVCKDQGRLRTAKSFGKFLEVLAKGGGSKRSHGALGRPPREVLHQLRDRLLEAMVRRGIKPTIETLLPLFEPALIPSDQHEIARLIVEMDRAGIGPRRRTLLRSMMALAEAGDTEGAEMFYNSIMEQVQEEGQGEDIETSCNPEPIAQRADLYSAFQISSSRSDPEQAISTFHDLLDRTRSNSSRPLVPHLGEPIWAQLFSTFSRSLSLQSSRLIELLHQLERSDVRLHDHSWRRIYHGLMLGFLHRREPRLVISLWSRLVERSFDPDSHMLDVVMRAHCSLGQVDQARARLDRWTFPSSVVDPVPRIMLDPIPVNNLMSYYNRIGSYDLAHDLFTSMQDRYGVTPDSSSLTILLDTARYASQRSNVWGLNEEDPSKFAERVFWSVLEQNWPRIAEKIVDPMKGKTNGMIDWIFPTKATAHPGGREEGQGHFGATLSIVDPPLYPHLWPMEKSFRSFIILLGTRLDAKKIPLVLAWMKEVGVSPERHALGLAMMYVGELALRDDKMVRWRAWLVDWLGEDQVPTEDEIAWLRRGGGKRRMP